MGDASSVLLLSASAGAGHVRAADALLKAFQSRPAVGRVEHWDMLKYTNRVFRHLYSRAYLDLVNRAPAMLGWFYDLADLPFQRDKARVIFEKLNAHRFIRAARTFAPDLVVCTHFTPAAVLSWLIDRGQWQLAPAVVVTDFDCHATWLVRNFSRYFVALEETRVYLERLGIDPAKIRVTGIPIDPLFETGKPAVEVRRMLGLAPDRFTILVSAGGYGVGPVERLIQELLSIRAPVQIAAIAGRSEELKAKLDALAAQHQGAQVKLHTVGFTTQMDEYMAAADILVGKAGGLTTSEALARGLPLCVINPIPGQEERNSDHLLEEGAAIRCNNLPALAWKLEQIIADAPRFERLRVNARRLGRPHAARAVVEELLRGATIV